LITFALDSKPAANGNLTFKFLSTAWVYAAFGMKFFLRSYLFCAGLLVAFGAFGQDKTHVPITSIPVKSKNDTTKIKKDSLKKAEKDTGIVKNGVQQIDLADAIDELFHITPNKKVDSITSKPSFSIVPALGYTLVSRFAIVVSGNSAFRTGPDSRISTVTASTSLTQNKQITLPILSNIWSKDNKWNFVGDWRIYKYPQSTFGLGSNSNILNVDPMDYSYLQFYETVLRHITGNIYLGMGYIIDDHWNISDPGNVNGTVSDYSLYGKQSKTVASGLTLNGQLDSRDNGINPSKGAFISVEYRDNYRFLGSDTKWSSLVIDVRKYFHFPEDSENVLALWNYEWLILNGRPGYLDLPSTQWDAYSATGRGYIQGRFRGADMVYGEAEYRFGLTDNGLLGGVFFLNGESLSAAPGTRLQSIQPGFGPGLRIKLNTISKTNIAIDYGFGRQGSNGLFIDVGEIF
jgi:hypothetical protein